MMNDPRNQSKRLMRDVRHNAGLPSSASVVKETFLRLGYTQDAMEPNDVVKRFNELLRSLWEETLKTLERYEEQSYASGIPRQLALQHHDSFAKAEEVANRKGFKEGFFSLFSDYTHCSAGSSLASNRVEWQEAVRILSYRSRVCST